MFCMNVLRPYLDRTKSIIKDSLRRLPLQKIVPEKYLFSLYLGFSIVLNFATKSLATPHLSLLVPIPVGP